MAGTEERLMILKMLQEGRIGAEEAERLLAALDRTEEPRHRHHEGPRPHPGPKPDFDFDFGEIGRGIREAVNGVADWVRKAAEQGRWEDAFGFCWKGPWTAADVSVEREFVLPLDPGDETALLTFSGASGDVVVTTADDARVTGKATVKVGAPDAEAARRIADETILVAEKRDGTIRVSLRSSRQEEEAGRARGRALVVRLELVVPRRMRLQLATASGSISTSGTESELLLATASGNLTLAPLGGALTAKTASGGVTLKLARSVRARVEATTASGSITVRAPPQIEELTKQRLVGVLNAPDVVMAMTTASGDIRVEAAEG